MPAITTKPETKRSRKRGNAFKLLSKDDLLHLTFFGALLGLAAPGIGVSFLAWFGLAPLLLAVAASKGLWQAAARGFVFGLAYNLVYLSWYLGLSPLDWLGFDWWQGWLLAGSALMINSLIQATIISVFSALMRVVPLTSSLIPEKVSGKWKLPAILIVPLLWTAMENKIGNAPDLLGVPWSMIEYTQYKQLELIQVASLIGGVGVSCLIVMTNLCVASAVATFSSKSKAKWLAASSKKGWFVQAMVTFGILSGSVALGYWQASRVNIPATEPVSILQGNININMQKAEERYGLTEIMTLYGDMLTKCKPGGLCVFTESAVPTYLSRAEEIKTHLALKAREKKLDLVVGAMDKTADGRPFNSAYGFTRDGKVLPEIYHKRFLVPFGEYTPVLVNYMPPVVRRLTNTPAGSGFESGKSAEVLKFSEGPVAPLICFECISPELVADSTRNGGELLCNLSDLAWFHKSFVGEQMIAFSVFRAIENRRYFVFSANTGPTAIIDPRGRIVDRSSIDAQTTILGKVGYSKEITPFTRWFR